MTGRTSRIARAGVLLGVFVVAASLSRGTAARASRFTLSGYYKNFSVAMDPSSFGAPGGSDAIQGLVTNRLRLEFDVSITSRLRFEAAYDFTPRVHERDFGRAVYFPVIDQRYYRLDDLRRKLYPADADLPASFDIIQNLDRACLEIDAGPADIYVGRQAVSWGSARVINPTDVVAPFTFDELDVEDRVGVDGLRVRMPAGRMGEIDLGCLAGKHAEAARSVFFSRSRFYLGRADVSVIVMDFSENLLAGFDVARAIGGAGAWLEAAYVDVDAFRRRGETSARSYLRLSLGCEYNLRGDLYTALEYHYSEAGGKDPVSYLSLLGRPAFREGAVYLLGRHYLAPVVSWQATPLALAESRILWNMSDGSVLFAPRVEYSLTGDIYLEAGMFAGLGESDSPAGNPFSFPSEFGSYPDVYYTSFRIYF
jgi:hypothetical protein